MWVGGSGGVRKGGGILVGVGTEMIRVEVEVKKATDEGHVSAASWDN